MEPMLARALELYHIRFTIKNFIPGQNTYTHNFYLDFRQTQQPNQGEGFLDIFFVGEILEGLEKSKCTEHPIEDSGIHFLNEDTMSQLVVSESAVTCFANQLADTPLMQLDLNEDRWNQMFGVDDFKFDTSSLATMLPIFKDKLGSDVPLKLKVSFKDIEILLGREVDVRVDFMMCYSIQMDLLGSHPEMEDCIDMVAAGNMHTSNDDVFIDLQELRADLGRGIKSKPDVNTWDMSANEYLEFLEDLESSFDVMKNYLNTEVFSGDQMYFPFTIGQMDIDTTVEHKRLHVLFSFGAKYYEYLETLLWQTTDPGYDTTLAFDDGQ
jgi:hypothetical protein